MDIYAQNILDRYKHPYHKDRSIEADISHKEANHSCGDTVTIQLKMEDGKAAKYAFQGSGCAISMAAADMMGDLIEEMTLDEVLALGKEEVYQMLGIEIGIRRSKCALLALLALQNGILEHRKEEKRAWTDYHV